MKQKILVTGGAGYIGTHVVAELVMNGYEVVVWDNFSTGHRAAIESIRGVEIRQVDTLNFVAVRRLFEVNRFDAVIDLAAYSRVAESVSDPLKYYRNNVEGARTLLEAAIKNGVDTFIYSSSAAVYGSLEAVPAKETDHTAPINPYGSTKLAVEDMLRYCHDAHGIKYVALRYFNAAGAWPAQGLGEDHVPESHLIPLVVMTAMTQFGGMHVYGYDYPTPDGTCIRDYVHVRDIAKAHVLALQYLQNGGESGPINLGSGIGYSVQEVLETAQAVLGQTIQRIYTDRRPGDPPILLADIQKAQNVLGWDPERSLKQMILDAYAWNLAHPYGYTSFADVLSADPCNLEEEQRAGGDRR